MKVWSLICSVRSGRYDNRAVLPSGSFEIFREGCNTSVVVSEAILGDLPPWRKPVMLVDSSLILKEKEAGFPVRIL